MSLLSMFDPTTSRSALGGITRSAIGALPGGQTALGVTDRLAASRQTTTSRAGATGAATLTPGAAFVPWYRKPVVLIGAAVAVVGLVVLLVFVRRR